MSRARSPQPEARAGFIAALRKAFADPAHNGENAA